MKRFAACALLLMGLTAQMPAEEKKEAAVSTATVPPALNFTVKDIDGKDVPLSKYQGKVVMIVNVASRCGATGQYAALQDLQKTFKDEGFVVLGFPCNQFGKQEPGTEQDIKQFCTSTYNVTFDMFAKIDVNDDKAAPLYKFLTSPETNPQHAGKIGWNFEKFLVGRDGKVVARYKTAVQPDDAQVVDAIKAELAKK